MPNEISQLAEGLESADAAERQKSAEALAGLGEAARGAAVPLIRACSDGEDGVREWATAALEGMGPPSVDDLPAMAKLVSERNDDVAYWAITLIGRLEEQASSAVPQLCAALDRSHAPSVQQRAAWALGKIGRDAAAAMDALQRAAGARDPRLARLAQSAVEAIRG